MNYQINSEALSEYLDTAATAVLERLSYKKVNQPLNTDMTKPQSRPSTMSQPEPDYDAFTQAFQNVQDLLYKDRKPYIRMAKDHVVVLHLAADLGIIKKPSDRKGYMTWLDNMKQSNLPIRNCPINISEYTKYITGQYPNWERNNKFLDLCTFERYRKFACILAMEYYNICKTQS